MTLYFFKFLLSCLQMIFRFLVFSYFLFCGCFMYVLSVVNAWKNWKYFMAKSSAKASFLSLFCPCCRFYCYFCYYFRLCCYYFCCWFHWKTKTNRIHIVFTYTSSQILRTCLRVMCTSSWSGRKHVRAQKHIHKIFTVYCYLIMAF